MNQSQLIRLTAALGAASVILGAFGAHGLRALVEPDQLAVYETGVRYQFFHTLAIGLGAALINRSGVRPGRIRLAVWLWVVGLLLFSGSLYLLSLRAVHGWPVAFLGPVTPVGGLLLMGGWLCLFFSTNTNERP